MYELNDWAAWIENFRKTTIKTYENEPDRIREDFGSESRVSDDYKGRALLELLQNADDAQIPETELTVKFGTAEILFLLTKDAFYCANGGYLMTEDGLNAICRLSHSPKDRSRLTIGEKGLGFKSVLSFSKIPEIHSGNLHCGFNRNEAFAFIYASEVIKRGRAELTRDTVPLLRLPVWINGDIWRNDLNLVELLKKYATVIKLPISETEFEVIYEKLKEITPKILLFLNFLKKIVVSVEGAIPKEYSIYRDEKIIKNLYEIVPCILKEGINESGWKVLRRRYDVGSDVLVGMSAGWENITKCEVAFAIPDNNSGHLVSGDISDKNIRAYFPTNEPFPLPILFHGTYYTDSSRKNINLEHGYNTYLTTKAAEFFVTDVFSEILELTGSDACAHLDLLDKSPVNDKTVGKYFSELVFEKLKDVAFIPDSTGNLKKPSEMVMLPFEVSQWEKWYLLLGESGCASLNLLHLNCAGKNRLSLLNDFQIKKAGEKQIVEALENSVQLNTEWFVRLYLQLNEMRTGNYFDETNGSKDVYLNSTLLFTSDNKVVCCNSIKVFMPPDEEKFDAVPDWLSIKFVNPEVVKRLGQDKDKILVTFFDCLGVKRYRFREILREVLSKNIIDYWGGKDTSLVPIELLRFLYELINKEAEWGIERPEKQTYDLLINVPVPTRNSRGDFVWSKSGHTYFSEDWLGCDFLEQLYGFDSDSRFLREKNYFKENGFDMENLRSFLYYIGVELQPRIVEINKKLTTLAYIAFWQHLKESYNDSVEDSFNSGTCTIYCDYVIDRLDHIFKNPPNAKLLLNYFAINPGIFENSNKTTLRYVPYKGWHTNPRTLSVATNYLNWAIENERWLYDETNKSYKPSEIFVPSPNLKQKFLNYLPYVTYEVSINPANWRNLHSFLIKIGVKDDIKEFNLEQWYNIILKVGEIGSQKIIEELDAEKIRVVYREFLRSDTIKITEGSEGIKQKFIKSGTLLAFYKGQYGFYPPSDVFYVDRPDLFDKFKEYIPCFQIETNRETRVDELFGVPSLSDSRKISPDFGVIDNTFSEPLNKLLEDAKPFLLARLSRRRVLKTEGTQLKQVRIIPVTKISVETTFKHPLSNKEVQIPTLEEDSLLFQKNVDGKKYWSIYLNVRIIKRGVSNYNELKHDDAVLSEIANRLSEFLKTDLAEAFQLILSKDNDSRKRLLRDNHIDDELLKECYNLLSQGEQPMERNPTEEPPPEQVTSREKWSGESTKKSEEVDFQKKDTVLWEDNGVPLTYVDLGVFAERGTSGKKDRPPSEPRHSGSGYQRDHNLRQKTDSAGMSIVMGYERTKGRVPDDTPSKQRSSINNIGPGCDIYAKGIDGKILRRIEVKSSLYNNIESIELTQTEIDTARNQFTGVDFYVYQVIKLDKEKYPEGPELLIFHDPYAEGGCPPIPVRVRLNLGDIPHEKVLIKSESK